MEISISDIKWVPALGTNYICFLNLSNDAEIKRGIYTAKLDFDKLKEDDREGLLNMISENKKLLESYEAPKQLLIWDAYGNNHVLSIAYSIKDEDNNVTSKLMVLTSPDGEFKECQRADHSDTKVNSIKVIVPHEDKETTFVVYGLAKGFDASKH